MNELSTPKLNENYKLRTHSNFTLLFQRSSNILSIDVITDSSKNILLKKPDQIIESNQLLQILCKSHSKPSDGKLIYELVRNYIFFNDLFSNNSEMKYDLDSIYNLCTKLQLEVYHKGAVILKEGAFSNNKMYLIASGRVYISQIKSTNFLDQDGQLKKSKSSRNIYLQSSEDFLAFITSRFGQIINELTEGNHFGERALISDQRNAIRSASCIAATNVYLITLKREDFMEVLKQFKQDVKIKKTLFEKVVPFFDQIASNVIVENLMYSFKEEIKKRDEKITCEQESADYMYILLSGEVAIMKHYQNHQFLLCLIGDIEIIGEDSLFEDKYLYTIVAVSQEVKLLKIGASSFHLRSPKQCVSGLKRLLDQKIKQRIKQLQVIANQNQKEQVDEELRFKRLQERQLMQAYQENEIIHLKTQISKKSTIKLNNLIESNYPFNVDLNSFRSYLSQNRISKNNLKLTNAKSDKQLSNLDNLKSQILEPTRTISLRLQMNKSQSPTINRSFRRIQNKSSVQILKEQMLEKKKKYYMHELKTLRDSNLIQNKLRCNTNEL